MSKIKNKHTKKMAKTVVKKNSASDKKFGQQKGKMMKNKNKDSPKSIDNSSDKKVGQHKAKKMTKNKDQSRKRPWDHKKQEEEESDFEEVEIASQQKSEKVVDDNSDIDDKEEQKNVRNLVTQQNRKNKKSGGFQSMGLSHNMYKGVTRKGYKIPTPIQRKTIPIIMDGKDVVAMARTGSGKTAAFLIPMFELLKTHSAKSGARALIMSPTRELALQTLKFAKELGKYTGLRAAVVLGGDRMEDQFAALHANPDIIIATPGRFMHVAVEMNLKLKSVQYVVFDEADRLFEMGFQEQLNEILNRLPEGRQTVLFSATLPKLLVEFAKAGLHDPTLIRLDVDSKLSDQLKMSFLQCRADDKLAVLLHLLKHIPESEQTVVFAATKHHVEYLNMVLNKADIPCTYIYSSLDPTARKINIAKFQLRKVKVMIVTDLAARGIDIPLLDNVINYNFPAKSKLFVHRVGRVARAGRSGVAYSLIASDELPYVFDLHVFLGKAVKFVQLGKQAKDDDGLYGCVPQSVIDEVDELLRAWHTEDYDIEAMVKVCKNAYGQYIRSRPTPAQESVKRVKEMEKMGQHIGIHPLFGAEKNTGEAERLKLLNALKSYKANTTIFEINSTAKNSSFNVMKRKRDVHGQVIDHRHQHMEDKGYISDDATADHGLGEGVMESDLQDAFSVVIGRSRSSTTASNQSDSSTQKRKKQEPVRDEENYISYRPADYDTEQGLKLGSNFDRAASSATFDLTGDDENNARKKTNAMRWDRKKKKYVRDNNEDPKKKKIRTESGAWIPASYKSHAYKDWVKKARIDTQVEKDDDDDKEEEQTKGPGAKNRLAVLGVTDFRRRHTKGSEDSNPGKSRDKFKKRKSELKRPEQIIKERKIKYKKQAFQQQRQNSHKVNKARNDSKKRK